MRGNTRPIQPAAAELDRIVVYSRDRWQMRLVPWALWLVLLGLVFIVYERTPLGPSLRMHLGIVLAVLATWAVAWMLNRSTFGFELRAVGSNPDASRTAGMSVTRTYVLTMVVSGALAGLGGAIAFLASSIPNQPPL